ncbi:prolipoprotein diacylglyceryl transferase [Flavihumibacter profundi]|jgi:phosphatidylglycerol---prolipoprotein diacylglyceryl transferase|uniref:prolipoprotein diacylglyceryl transferase n=1 Tax=Flavihumibacter profundi TaxID=2716883 RepID=UPI001CC4D008|nr:prolipoprotein diacylglyceryl transferase family protein [Flavihumibacter profundi]MBZ5856247.1 prolipoprotein diacylglyceryl transferase [Flavihumibacter profundi]
MYPNLYYAFKDLFGLNLPGLRFINSFGFFVAIAFLVAAWILSNELRRKSKEGLLQYEETTITIGKPASFLDLLTNFILGFLLGYKIIGAFVIGPDDPQSFIFSSQGSWAAGILTGLFFAALKWWEKNKEKLPKPEDRKIRIWPQDRVGDIVVFAALFGFGGAKIFHNLENWTEFIADPIGALLSFSGLTFYGGLICAAIAILWYGKRHGISMRHLCDAAAPALMISYAIGRIGCQVSGDGDWGIANNSVKPFSWIPNWAWAYTYPHNVINAGIPIPGCSGNYCSELPFAVYPTAFYETLMCLVLFGVIWYFRKKIVIPGRIFAFYLVLNGMERFLIEKIRVNTKYSIFGFHPTQAELISSALIILGLVLWFLVGKLPVKEASKVG